MLVRLQRQRQRLRRRRRRLVRRRLVLLLLPIQLLLLALLELLELPGQLHAQPLEPDQTLLELQGLLQHFDRDRRARLLKTSKSFSNRNHIV
jgi:hypothetical protein